MRVVIYNTVKLEVDTMPISFVHGSFVGATTHTPGSTTHCPHPMAGSSTMHAHLLHSAFKRTSDRMKNSGFSRLGTSVWGSQALACRISGTGHVLQRFGVQFSLLASRRRQRSILRPRK